MSDDKLPPKWQVVFKNNKTGKLHKAYVLGETESDVMKAWNIRYGEYSTILPKYTKKVD